MSRDSERIALYTHLQSILPEGTTLRYETISEDDEIIASHELWLLCKLTPYASHQKNLGVSNPLKRSLGDLLVKVFGREENGFADIYRMIDILEANFLHKTFDNGTLYIDRISQVQHPSYKGWNCIDVVIDYHADTTI